jgi:hypothetical protein
MSPLADTNKRATELKDHRVTVYKKAVSVAEDECPYRAAAVDEILARLRAPKVAEQCEAVRVTPREKRAHKDAL